MSSTEQLTPGSSRGITRTGPITVDFSGYGTASSRTCVAPEVMALMWIGPGRPSSEIAWARNIRL